MKSSHSKIALAAIVALGGVSGLVHDVRAAVVINEVYGGGGSTSTSASYKQDFVELYNNGTAAVDLSGYSIRYASATNTVFPFISTGTGTSAGVTSAVLPVVTLNSFSLAPGQFFLISGATAAGVGGGNLPTADATSTLAAGQSTGEIGLFASATATALLDLIGYGGTAAKQFEGAAVAALSITTSAYRTVAGVDTDNNKNDFTVGTPTPQNSATPEPASLGLVAIGSALALRRRSR